MPTWLDDPAPARAPLLPNAAPTGEGIASAFSPGSPSVFSHGSAPSASSVTGRSPTARISPRPAGTGGSPSPRPSGHEFSRPSGLESPGRGPGSKSTSPRSPEIRQPQRQRIGEPPPSPRSPRRLFSPWSEDQQIKWDGAPIDTLVLKGGGTMGAAYTGAVARLEKADLMKGITNFAGTSAGSQTAALLAFGFTSLELEEIHRTAPLSKLLDPSFSCCSFLDCRNLCRLYRQFGWARGDVLENFLDAQFEKKIKKKRCTFQDFHEWSIKRFGQARELKLGASNMATRTFEILDRYTHKDMPICVACRASSSTPFVFVPRRWQLGEGQRDALYVDSGCEGNLPILAFKSPNDGGRPARKILALNLVVDQAAPGEVVRLWGLRSKPEFNGAEGTLVRFDAESRRWEIKMKKGGVTIHSKPEHVQVCCHEPGSFHEFIKTTLAMMRQATLAQSQAGPDKDVPQNKLQNVDIININTGHWSALDVDIVDTEMTDLIQCGYTAVAKYLGD